MKYYFNCSECGWVTENHVCQNNGEMGQSRYTDDSVNQEGEAQGWLTPVNDATLPTFVDQL